MKNLEFAEFDNPKIKLNDGSRLIGKKLKRNGKIDIITGTLGKALGGASGGFTSSKKRSY